MVHQKTEQTSEARPKCHQSCCGRPCPSDRYPRCGPQRPRPDPAATHCRRLPVSPGHRKASEVSLGKSSKLTDFPATECKRMRTWKNKSDNNDENRKKKYYISMASGKVKTTMTMLTMMTMMTMMTLTMMVMVMMMVMMMMTTMAMPMTMTLYG